MGRICGCDPPKAGQLASLVNIFSECEQWSMNNVVRNLFILQIFIEATSGGNSMGDIALDNVILRPGLCCKK